MEAPRGVELTSTNDRRSLLSVWRAGEWSVDGMERCGHGSSGIRFSASVLRFPGYRLVFPRIEDLRRQWHRGDAQSPFRTWKLSPVAAMVLRSEGRGRVARCRITRQGGVLDSCQRVRHPPFFLFFLFLPTNTPHTKKQNKTKTHEPRNNRPLSGLPCVCRQSPHRLGTDPTWRSRSGFLEDDALEMVAYGAEPARQRQPTRSEPDLA